MVKKVVKLWHPFSQGGPKRGNTTRTTSSITARRKGDPQHYVEGKTAASAGTHSGVSCRCTRIHDIAVDKYDDKFLGTYISSARD